MYYNLIYPMKLVASICTVQRYCENMIYCEAIQYFGSFQFIHSQVDVLYSVLLRLRLIYCLVQQPRLLIFSCQPKEKKHFTTLLQDIEDLNITRKHTLAPGHCFHISVETFLSHEATTTNHKATRKRLKTIALNGDFTLGLESDLRGPPWALNGSYNLPNKMIISRDIYLRRKRKERKPSDTLGIENNRLTMNDIRSSLKDGKGVLSDTTQ